MIKVPFCYKVWGLSVDEEGNEDYGYVRVNLEAKEKPDKEIYKKLHKAFSKNIPFGENVELIDVEEYIKNQDLTEEEIQLLMEYKDM